MTLLALVLSLFTLVGCAKDSSGHSSPADSPQPPAQNTDRKVGPPQQLKVYDGTDNSLNSLQAVNATPGEITFDFLYKPDEDVRLSLPVFGGKFYLIGCKESDVAISFDVFRYDSNSQLQKLGGFPIDLLNGSEYLVRVKLDSRGSCLGIRYTFAVERARLEHSNGIPTLPTRNNS